MQEQGQRGRAAAASLCRTFSKVHLNVELIVLLCPRRADCVASGGRRAAGALLLLLPLLLLLLLLLAHRSLLRRMLWLLLTRCLNRGCSCSGLGLLPALWRRLACLQHSSLLSIEGQHHNQAAMPLLPIQPPPRHRQHQLRRGAGQRQRAADHLRLPLPLRACPTVQAGR